MWCIMWGSPENLHGLRQIDPAGKEHIVSDATMKGNDMKSYSYNNDMEFLEMVDEYVTNDYVRRCLLGCLEWYMVMYHKYKFRYHVSSLLGLVLPPCVIVINGIQDFEGMYVFCKVAISVISAVAAIANGLGSLYKWHEKSVGYRSCIEQIKCEAVYYMAEIGDYDDPELRDSNFIEKIEDITVKENQGWSQLELKKQEEDVPPTEEEQEEKKPRKKKEEKHGRKEKNNARHDCCTGEEV